MVTGREVELGCAEKRKLLRAPYLGGYAQLRRMAQLRALKVKLRGDHRRAGTADVAILPRAVRLLPQYGPMSLFRSKHITPTYVPRATDTRLSAEMNIGFDQYMTTMT
jgi:hypothetical protein